MGRQHKKFFKVYLVTISMVVPAIAWTDKKLTMEEMMVYLRSEYNLRSTLVITSNDNGSGYVANVFSELVLRVQRWVRLLDQYYMNHLKGRLPDQPKLFCKL